MYILFVWRHFISPSAIYLNLLPMSRFGGKYYTVEKKIIRIIYLKMKLREYLLNIPHIEKIRCRPLVKILLNIVNGAKPNSPAFVTSP